MNDCDYAAKLRVLTLCTEEGARFRVSQKNRADENWQTGFLLNAFIFAIYCVGTIEAVVSAACNPLKFFPELTQNNCLPPFAPKCSPT